MAKLRALDQYRQLMNEITSLPTSSVASSSSRSVPGGDDSSLLLRGALLIARHRYPSMDETKVYDMLDEMARRVAALLPSDPSERYPLRVVGALNRVRGVLIGVRRETTRNWWGKGHGGWVEGGVTALQT